MIWSKFYIKKPNEINMSKKLTFKNHDTFMRGSSNNNFGHKNSCVKTWKVKFVTSCIIIKKPIKTLLKQCKIWKLMQMGQSKKNYT